MNLTVAGQEPLVENRVQNYVDVKFSVRDDVYRTGTRC